MRLFIIISILFTPIFSLFSQENGVNLSFQRFDFSHPKSNITNNWSWIGVNYCHSTKSRYSFQAGINFNSSYLFTKSNYLFNPIPRGKNLLENLGLNYSNKLLIKKYEDKLYWTLSNQINLNSTRIYSTYIDSTGAGTNLFTDKFILFRADLGLDLKAKIVGDLFFSFNPSIEYFRLNSSDFGQYDGFRGKLALGLTYYFKSK
jgi:hypothetical protein